MISMCLKILDTSYKWNHAAFVFLRLVYSFRIMPLWFLHVVPYNKISFIFKVILLPIVCVYQIWVVTISWLL